MKKKNFKKKLLNLNQDLIYIFFILNTLLKITFNGWWHCVCGKGEEKKKMINVEFVKYQ